MARIRAAEAGIAYAFMDSGHVRSVWALGIDHFVSTDTSVATVTVPALADVVFGDRETPGITLYVTSTAIGYNIFTNTTKVVVQRDLTKKHKHSLVYCQPVAATCLDA